MFSLILTSSHRYFWRFIGNASHLESFFYHRSIFLKRTSQAVFIQLQIQIRLIMFLFTFNFENLLFLLSHGPKIGLSFIYFILHHKHVSNHIHFLKDFYKFQEMLELSLENVLVILNFIIVGLHFFSFHFDVVVY